MAKTGRKPKGPYENKTVVFSARLRPDTKTAIERAARKKGWALSQEVEHRLRLSIEADRQIASRYGSDEIFGLAKIIQAVVQETGSVARFGEPDFEKNWLSDPYAYDQAVKAVLRVLEALRPEGEIKLPGYTLMKGGPKDLDFEAIAKDLGRNIADYVIAKVANEGDVPGVGKADIENATMIRRRLAGSDLLKRVDKRGKRQ